MYQFVYTDHDCADIGTFNIISSDFPIEANIQANGWDFHIIVGKHINGNYICIPNWNVGSELAALEDYLWNYERLSNYTNLDDTNSNIISSALVEIGRLL
mgnify:CR=1 FL=1